MSVLLFLVCLAAIIMAAKALADIGNVRTMLRVLSLRLDLLEMRFAAMIPTEMTTTPAAPVQNAPIEDAPIEEAPPPVTFAPPLPTAPGFDWEKHLAEYWLVWLGGVTLALAGGFLVKLSIDHGLLVPPVRVAMGLVLGVVLCMLGEKIFRRERDGTAKTLGPVSVPQALVAAGLATVFADVYAAYQLYDLIPAALAYPLLAATAGMAVLMSLRHGAFVAGLGLVGAFVVPLLVHGDQPHPLALFAYLGIAVAASLVVLRYKAWHWLAWVSLAAPLAWVLFWLAVPYQPGDAPVLGGFLIALLGLFITFRWGIAAIPLIAGPIDHPVLRALMRAAFWSVSLLLPFLALIDGFGTMSLACVFIAGGITLYLCYRDEDLDDLLASAAAPVLAMLAFWVPITPHVVIQPVIGEVPVEATTRFVIVALLGAAMFGGAGVALLRRVARPARWASLAAAVPLAILALAYWRLHSRIDLPWAVLGVTLAAIDLGIAYRLDRYRGTDPRFEPALAAFAVAILGSVALAMTMQFEDAWLSVALSLCLPGIAWVDGKIRLPVLRHLALGVAGVVLVRLALNPEILHYALAPSPIFNWLLYGYGVPMVAFMVATRQFGSRQDDLLVGVLEAGSIGFMTALVTFELRHALGHRHLDVDLGDLTRDSLQALAWLVMAAALLRIGATRKRPVLTWGGIGLFALATFQAVIWQAVIANPLWTGDSVGTHWLTDALLVAYGLPALLYAVIGIAKLGPAKLWWPARGLALGFALLWLTLEVRHIFRGPYLDGGTSGSAEWYAYSASWLVFACLLLAAGLRFGNIWLRRIGFAGLGLVVAKVFLSDVAALGGIWRAVSFLGLGGTLVGIGYVYRRLGREG